MCPNHKFLFFLLDPNIEKYASDLTVISSFHHKRLDA